MSVEIEWDGRIWPSITAAARHEGVDRNTIRYWLALPSSRPHSTPVTIRGVEYPSMKAAGVALGVQQCVVRNAWLRGTLDNVGLRKARLGNVWAAE